MPQRRHVTRKHTRANAHINPSDHAPELAIDERALFPRDLPPAFSGQLQGVAILRQGMPQELKLQCTAWDGAFFYRTTELFCDTSGKDFELLVCF